MRVRPVAGLVVGALWRTVLPLAAPGMFTAGILAFVNAWDEFPFALSFNADPMSRTLPIGIVPVALLSSRSRSAWWAG